MKSAEILSKAPRIRLMDGPTPIQRLDRLEQVLGHPGGVSIWAKRDDLMALGGGGNKLRKLEFLLGQARSEGCDTMIAIGGVQSNFARLAAAACARHGLRCELVLAQMVPRTGKNYQKNGNVLLDHLFGAKVHVLSSNDDPARFAAGLSDAAASSGGKAFIATLGGSTTVGCLGYTDCALEILAQTVDLGFDFDQIVVPNGSGGMHAGLAAGMILAGSAPSRIKGYTVLSPEGTSRSATLDKVNAVLDILSIDDSAQAADVIISADQLGDGYGLPTSAMAEAVRLLGYSEGLLLDPVYGGKAFAGMISDIRQGAIAPGSNVLFVMTGGSPGLYAYADLFL